MVSNWSYPKCDWALNNAVVVKKWCGVVTLCYIVEKQCIVELCIELCCEEEVMHLWNCALCYIVKRKQCIVELCIVVCCEKEAVHCGTVHCVML